MYILYTYYSHLAGLRSCTIVTTFPLIAPIFPLIAPIFLLIAPIFPLIVPILYHLSQKYSLYHPLGLYNVLKEKGGRQGSISYT